MIFSGKNRCKPKALVLFYSAISYILTGTSFGDLREERPELKPENDDYDAMYKVAASNRLVQIERIRGDESLIPHHRRADASD